jgi:hypothetical protein
MALQPAQVEVSTHDAESIRTDFSFHRVGVAATGIYMERLARTRPAVHLTRLP